MNELFSPAGLASQVLCDLLRVWYSINVIRSLFQQLTAVDDVKMDDDSAYYEDTDEELAFESEGGETDSEESEYDYHEDDGMYGSKRPKLSDIDAEEREIAKRKALLDAKKK